MICVDSLHISLNRTLLIVIGLWPYQQSKLARIQLIVFYSILTTIILFQFTTFITSKCTLDLLINVLASVLFYIMFIIKYNLLEQLQHMCNELSDENEINIIKKYGSNAKRYTATLLILSMSLTSVFTLYPFWPFMFDILFPINETRPHLGLLLVTEYFIDQEKYYYLILIHINAATFIGIITMLATGTILIVYQQHACGMFRIASYRIEQAMTIDTLYKNNLIKETLIYKGLICAIDMHRKAMKFSNSSISEFKVMFFLMIVAGVISTAINFFRIFQIVTFGYNIEKLLFPVIFSIINALYMFIGSYFGQKIMDHNNDVLVTVYNVRWYTAPLHIQKMILFLLQRGSKVFNLNIAGLFVGSFEGAATLVSATLSYFTVHSTQSR
ncbi:hypothetical protein P5V15_008176 [Pogonomyrmex californicus]